MSGIGGGHLGSGGQIRSSEINQAAANAALSLDPLPRITYNGKNIDFPEDLSVMPWEPEVVGVQNIAVAGDPDTVVDRSVVRVSVFWKYLSNEGASDDTRRRQLRQFSQWAQAGLAFAFARNRTKVVNTTLASDVSAGASTIAVTSAAGITEGDEYVLLDEFFAMPCKVSGIAGTNITLEESIDYEFLSGARFRYAEYWPVAVLAPGEQVLRERSPMHYDVEFDFVEDVSGL